MNTPKNPYIKFCEKTMRYVRVIQDKEGRAVGRRFVSTASAEEVLLAWKTLQDGIRHGHDCQAHRVSYIGALRAMSGISRAW